MRTNYSEIENSESIVADAQPSFAPLVTACARYGIGRTSAFKLARDGDIEVFHIGARAFVRLASLESLPDRIAAKRHHHRGRA